MNKWDDLCATIGGHREQAEDTARLAPEVLKAAGDVGLWRLCAPLDVNGLEMPIPEQLAVYEKIGAADPTVGWHGLNTSATGLVAAWLPEPDRRDVFMVGDRPCGLGFSPSAATVMPGANGEYTLDGRWPFMTGSADAAWCTVIARYEGAEGGPPVRRVVVPAQDLEIELTWDRASGMRGTGSHAVKAHGVKVPSGRVINPSDPPLIDRPLFRWPSSSALWGLAASLTVGILRSAVVSAIELNSGKFSSVDGHAHFAEPRPLAAIGNATAAVDAMSAGLRTLADDMWESYVAGEIPSPALRAHWWSLIFYSFDLSCEHVSRLYSSSTSAVYANRNRLDRALRDIHAISVAFESFQGLRRAASKVLMGQEADHPTF